MRVIAAAAAGRGRTVSAAGIAGSDAEVRGIRDLGLWEAWDAWQAGRDAAGVAELTGGGDAAFHVRQAALEQTICRWMRAWATISVHRALLAGADVTELAHAMGFEAEELSQRWRDWADGQRRLNDQCPGLGIARPEYQTVLAVLAERAARHAGSATARDAPAGDGTQIGSPRL